MINLLFFISNVILILIILTEYRESKGKYKSRNRTGNVILLLLCVLSLLSVLLIDSIDLQSMMISWKVLYFIATIIWLLFNFSKILKLLKHVYNDE